MFKQMSLMFKKSQDNSVYIVLWYVIPIHIVIPTWILYVYMFL